jgi:competence protein ComEC
VHVIWCLLALLSARAWGGTLTLELLDVGQGDSILLRTPAGKTVLIDAGTGKSNVPAMLQARGVTQLDLVIATHNHADHIGGMDEVLTQIPVKYYFDQGMEHETGTYVEVMRIVEEKGIAYKPGRLGQKFNLDDGIRVEMLAPQDPLLKNTRSDLNSNSIITRVTHGEVCFLLTGDAELETERRLLDQHLAPCEVLKVAHHGSAYATSHHFLKVLQPEIAIISVGAENRYGHPAESTLQRIEHGGARIYRTDLHGTIRLESDGKQVEVIVEQGPDGKAPVGARLAPAPFDVVVSTGIPAVDAPHRAPRTETAQPLAPTPELSAPAGNTLVNLNDADLARLMTLPGIGPKKAEEIIRWREKNGPYASIEALEAVPGIGEATIKTLRPLVTVEAP